MKDMQKSERKNTTAQAACKRLLGKLTTQPEMTTALTLIVLKEIINP